MLNPNTPTAVLQSAVFQRSSDGNFQRAKPSHTRGYFYECSEEVVCPFHQVNRKKALPRKQSEPSADSRSARISTTRTSGFKKLSPLGDSGVAAVSGTPAVGV